MSGKGEIPLVRNEFRGLTVVVGFNFPFLHDSAVAVILDGELVFATEEERFTRHKHAILEFPINSLIEAIKYLQRLGIKATDIDAFAVNFNPKLFPLRQRTQLYFQAWIGALEFQQEKISSLLPASIIRGFNYLGLAYSVLKHVYNRLGYSFPDHMKIIPVDHHLTHAATAHYFSGFSSSAILTMDGQGERESTVIWRVKNGEFEKILTIENREGSVGWLYDTVSEKLGFNYLEGPGKVMGLAPYGQHEKALYDKFETVFKVSDTGDTPYAIRKEFRSGSKDPWRLHLDIADFLARGLDLKWEPRRALGKDPSNLAWGLQDCAERLIVATAEWSKENTGESKLALAGGVALNARANMILHYSKIYNDMFVFPAANDAGTPIGAAAYVYEKILGHKMTNRRLDHVYLGCDYAEEYVKETIRKSKWNANYLGDDVNEVAEMVSKGSVVAFYQGRSELGPRALGNRSIVANPCSRGMWQTVNEIKGREFWRPIAPSVLDEDKGEFFRDPVEHRFMVLMFEMTESGASRAPAVCHLDMTSRPQMVTRTHNKRWYDLIRSFKEITGEGLAVNTSFNLAGEPLVETPHDALRSFATGGLDAIYLQGWLIRK